MNTIELIKQKFDFKTILYLLFFIVILISVIIHIFIYNTDQSNSKIEKYEPKKPLIYLEELPKYFYNRTVLFNQLNEKMNKLNENGKRFLILHGTPGIGKSTLALQYARYFKDINPNQHIVLWIKAENEESFLESFKDIFKDLDLNKTNNNKEICDQIKLIFNKVRVNN